MELAWVELALGDVVEWVCEIHGSGTLAAVVFCVLYIAYWVG